MRQNVTGEEDLNDLGGKWGPNGEPESEEGIPRIHAVEEIKSIRAYANQKINFIVDSVIADQTVNLISGESGAGKTTWTTAMVSAIERGLPFAGLPTQRRPVAILDRENPLPVVVERFDRLGINDSPNFLVWGQWALQDAPEPGSQIILDWVERCTPRPVIVVDSLVSFHQGDENDAAQTRVYMNQFRKLTAAGATVILLHHSGKGDSAKDYRGSSDIKASVDVAYHLSNLGDAARLSTIRLRAFKSRLAVTTETLFQYRDGQFTRDGEPVSDTNATILRDLLIANPGINVRTFEAGAIERGVHRGRVRAFIDTSVASGEIHASKGFKNATIYCWIGTENGGEI